MNSTPRRNRLSPFHRFTTWLVIASLLAGAVPSGAQSPEETPSGPGRIGVAAHESGWVCSVILDETPSVRGQSRVGHFAYGNRGSEPIDIPYVHLDAGEGTSLRFLPTDEWTGQLELMAISGTAPASKLDPGEFRQIAFFYKSEGDAVSVHCGYTLSDPTPFPWDAAGTYMRPDGIGNDFWKMAFEILRNNMGPTWDSYLNRMRADCDYLMGIGQPEYRLPLMWELETDEALGVDYAVSGITSDMDLARDTRDGSLALFRTYSASTYHRFEHGPFGWGWMDSLSEIQDGAGVPFSVERNSSDRIVAIRHQDGQTLSFAYDENGNITIARDDQGRVVHYEYENGCLVRVVSWNGLVTRYKYLPEDGSATSRALRQIVAPDGSTQDFTYDATGKLKTVSRNGNRLTSEILRRKFGSYAIVSPNGGVTEVTRGISGNTLRIVDALGHVHSNEYAPNGMQSATVSPSGKRNVWQSDLSGRFLYAEDANGAKKSFSYGTGGELSGIVDARGNVVRFGYDGASRFNSIVHPDNSEECVRYLGNGDIGSVVNRRGQAIKYEYDAEGRVIGEQWPDGRTMSWKFDARGNCTRAEDSETGAVTIRYDAADRVLEMAYPNGYGFKNGYDAYGRLASRQILGSENVQTYEYDALGRFIRMKDGAGKLLLEWLYDEKTGEIAGQRMGNGTLTRYRYDLLGRIARIAHVSSDGREMAFFAYGYDEDGQCISIETKEGTEQYEYDAIGQLVKAVYADGETETFSYDAAGNRVKANDAIYAVNEMNQCLRIEDKGNVTSFEYDADGNLVRKTEPDGATTEYEYDALNRLISARNNVRGIDWSCQYDVFGNRIQVVDRRRSVEKLYFQGLLPSVAADLVDGKLVAEHVHMGAVRVADISPSGSKLWYHLDKLGSTRLATGDDGRAVGEASYKAFGALRASSGTIPAADWLGGIGVERDSTGLVFMRARHYDPDLGRFLQMDPLKYAAGDGNLYRYCQNDPIDLVDPSGRVVVLVVAGVAITAEAVAYAAAGAVCLVLYYNQIYCYMRGEPQNGLLWRIASKAVELLNYAAEVQQRQAQVQLALLQAFLELTAKNASDAASECKIKLPNRLRDKCKNPFFRKMAPCACPPDNPVARAYWETMCYGRRPQDRTGEKLDTGQK